MSAPRFLLLSCTLSLHWFAVALGGSWPSNTFYGGETTTTYWYAPSARAIVKSAHHNPYLSRTFVELVALQRRP